jgi:septum formation protein
MNTDKKEKKLILASGSPRRRQLMAEAGYRFEVIPSQVDEITLVDQTLSSAQVAMRIAAFKARDIAAGVKEPAVVLGADTIVVCDNEILGKARDADHARQMLYRLSRTRHCVITGVVLIDTDTGRETIEADTTGIHMRPMNEEEIEEYIAGGAWQDKAGAYGVQEGADKFIIDIDGSYSNVVGLPMELVKKMLAEFGF